MQHIGEAGARWTQALKTCPKQCEVPGEWRIRTPASVWKREGDVEDIEKDK